MTTARITTTEPPPPPVEERPGPPSSESETSPARSPDADRADASPPADGASPSGDEAAADAFPLTRGDTLVAALLGIVLVVLLGLHAARLSGWGARPILVEHAPRDVIVRLNLNEANWVELAQLEAVGEVLARRIVEDRTERGPFQTVDDLRRVKGIGAKTLEKLRPLVRVNGPAEGGGEK